jgi:hypothetical protein
MSEKSKQARTSLRKAKQNVWYRQERKWHHGGVLGVEPGTAVRVNPGLWEKISDPQDLVIFNKAKKMCSRILINLEGRLKSHPSFTSLLLNNLFRETVFSLLHLVRKQENRDYRMESPFQHRLGPHIPGSLDCAPAVCGSVLQLNLPPALLTALPSGGR